MTSDFFLEERSTVAPHWGKRPGAETVSNPQRLEQPGVWHTRSVRLHRDRSFSVAWRHDLDSRERKALEQVWGRRRAYSVFHRRIALPRKRSWRRSAAILKRMLKAVSRQNALPTTSGAEHQPSMARGEEAREGQSDESPPPSLEGNPAPQRSTKGVLCANGRLVVEQCCTRLFRIFLLPGVVPLTGGDSKV